MIKDIQELNFPSYTTLSSATVTLNDMGDRTISAQVKIDGSIVPDFSYDWEVEFKGERYIQPLRQPQASKGNESMRSTIDLVFYHKTIWQLKRYYFVEMTSTESGTAIADQYIASLGLNLYDFCVAFQKVLDHYFDGEISIDLNPNLDYTKGVQFMSISYSYIWDVLQKMYEVYGVRWHIEGNTIKVGYPSPILSHTFQYGYEGGLLQVERQVQDANIRNSLLGRGGEQNLPAYYFKEAPEGSLFASDPDAIPELANIYFSNLRGKTFRDYVKGWKAKHYGGEPMQEPTEAYTKGYTDIKFNPIEYVEDKESIEKYGLLQGALDNNEEIYPSIQGAPNGEDVVVYVEPVTSDDVEQSVGKAETIALNGMSQFRTITREQNGSKIQVALQSEVFEVPNDSYALTIGNNVTYNIYQGFNFTPIWEGNPLVEVTEVVTNKDTNEVVDKESLPKGKYQVVTTFDITLPIYNDWPTIGSADNISFYAQLGISTNLQLRKSQDVSTDKWLPTFNIWVKNIWNSTRNSGESDLEYAERVWRPILGDRQGNEAKVVFSSGWLSGHEDYEFAIVDFAYDNSHEHNGTQSEWKLTLNKSDAELEATGKYIPSATTNGQAYAGDTFFFIGIDMPHQYVLWAEERLDNYKASSLNEVSEIQPKWVVRFDKLRLHEEEDNLAEQIVVGGAINLADVRFIDAPALQLYLQSVTYTWSEQTLLYPDIEVVLADTIVPVQNPVAQLQGSIDAINSQLYNIGNVAQTVRKIGDSLYLRKDGVADTSKSPTKFVGNVSGNNFRQGKVGGADWGIYRDENGNAIAEFDKIIARKDLEVNNLVINQVSYVGGMQITSAASIEITRVIENDNTYQCFFDQKGGSVANLFAVNDIAYSQRFDQENNATKYYKRVVTEVGVDYITLSKSQADGEGVPMANDVVIHYGNTTDPNRQYVIIRDVIGGGYERMLSGLDSVLASGVEYYFAGRMNGNTPRWFVGNDNQFIEYKDGHLQIKADVTIGANSDLSASDDFKQLQEDIESLQNQIDGKVEAFYFDYDPSADTYPTNEWTTDELKEEHLNDTFTNIESGQSWRWLFKDGSYQWVAISDTQALQMAQEALNLANSKVTIFTDTPKPPYKVNDLWFQGEGGNTKRCIKARTEQETYNADDWVNADDYKDFASSVAGDAEQNAKKYADSQISSYDLTIKYLKDAFNKGSVLDVNGVTLSALVGVKDENGSVVAGLYGGGSDTLNNAGYSDPTHGAMLLFGGIEGVDKPKTYKTAIFEDGFLQSTYFATAKEGKRVEIFGNELKVYGDDTNNSVLSISYDSTGKPRLQYTDKSGNVAWYLSDSGISTSYTVAQADNTFVKRAGDAQSISAQHNFVNGLKIGGLGITKSQDDVIYVDANLVVRGAVTMFGSGATIAPSIWASIPFNPEHMSWDGSQWNIVGGGSGSVNEATVNNLIYEYLTKNSYAKISDISSALTGYATQTWVEGKKYLTGITSSMVTTALGYTPYNSANFTKANIKSTLGISDWALAATLEWSAVNNRPTKLSQFTDDVVAGKYLPLSGGTVNGSITATSFVGTLDGQATAASLLRRTTSSTAWCVANGNALDIYNVHSTKSFWFGYSLPEGSPYATNEWHFGASDGTGKDSGKVYASSFIGNLTGNADSATKLATARSIWGQPFNGTDNIGYDGKSQWLFMNYNGEGIYITGDSISWHNSLNALAKDLLGFAADGTVSVSNKLAVGRTTADYAIHIDGITKTRGFLSDSIAIESNSSGAMGSNGGEINRATGILYLQYDNSKNVSLCYGGGSVAVGGTTADYKLHVHGVGGFKDGLWAQGIRLENTDEINSYGSMGGTGNGALYLNYRSNGYVILAKGGGYVGIGSTEVEAKLHVHGDAKINTSLTVATNVQIPANGDRITFNSVSGTYTKGVLAMNANNTYFEAPLSSDSKTASKPPIMIGWTDGTYPIYINSNTNVAIGGTSASAKLHVRGDILADGAITMFSQLSMKNVIDYEGLSLAQLEQIKPARFTWKDGRDNRIHVGGIADYIQPIIPEVVYETVNKELTVDYGSAAFYIGTSLIKPVVELWEVKDKQQQEIESLKKRVEYLENENRQLRAS